MTLVSLPSTITYIEFCLTNLYVNSLLIMVNFTKHQLPLIPLILVNFKLDLLPGLANPLANIHPILILLIFSNILLNTGRVYSAPLWFVLLLGGWWASQEFNWGGWWNWDLIETPSLMLSLVMLYQFHLNLMSASYRSARFNFILVVMVLLVCINTRYMGTSSVHSFVTLDTCFEYLYFKLYFNIFGLVLYASSVLSLTNLNMLSYIIFWVSVQIVLVRGYSMLKVFKVKSTHHLILYLHLIYLFYPVQGKYSNFSDLTVVSLSKLNFYGNLFMYNSQIKLLVWVKEIVNYL